MVHNFSAHCFIKTVYILVKIASRQNFGQQEILSVTIFGRKNSYVVTWPKFGLFGHFLPLFLPINYSFVFPKGSSPLWIFTITIIVVDKGCLTSSFSSVGYLQGTDFAEDSSFWSRCAAFKNITTYDGCSVNSYMVYDQILSKFVDAGTPRKKFFISKGNQMYCFWVRTRFFFIRMV